MTFIILFLDDYDYCGCWKTSGHMHETYTDVKIAFVDAKVVSAMCKGGAITHAIDDLTGISDNWILEPVVPYMVAHGMNHQVCKVLGRAVLF